MLDNTIIEAMGTLSENERNQLVGEGLIDFLRAANQQNADPIEVATALNKLVEAAASTGELSGAVQQNLAAVLSNSVVEARAPKTPVRFATANTNITGWDAIQVDNFATVTQPQRVAWRTQIPVPGK